ncbi:MAG TPA: histidine--tRNA ligase [Candidatus Acidoferrales bacterium]|nr:histidine--tRNA ligase [Candidatus Acidoferrales bacterium]
MPEKRQYRAIKGTRDILPPDSALWNWFEQTAREVFESYNFREIRLPIFEQTELFARSVGTETDIVSKEMFTFRLPDGSERLAQEDTSISQAGDQVSLRPEATASTMRAYIEHNLQALPGNVKLYCIGPMFRRERPQKGRYRQFYQVNAEILGQSDAPAIDAELLEMLLLFFARVGLTRTTLYVNSIGDKNCRPQYVELLHQELLKVKDQLGPDSQRRIETNPLRVLDSKLPQEQEIIGKLPRISDHLCVDCREHFAKLKAELKLRGIAYQENWRLVRGLDYYTRTTFEVIAEGLGSQNAVCGGGRYDGLVELLGGPPTKGIGFAIGSDRAILSIQESGNLRPLPVLDVFVAWMGEPTYPTAVGLARKLRESGLSVELPGEEMKFKKSLNLADKLGARYALIIGSDEVMSGNFTLKRLADADQKKLSQYELLEYLESEKRGTRG